MKMINQIGWIIFKDILRSRWSIANTLFFAAITTGLLYLQADNVKVAVSISSLSIILIPLISLIYTAMYFYNSRNFIELILTQPIGRRVVFLGLLLGITTSLIAGFVLGIGLPYTILGSSNWTDIKAFMTLLLIVIALSCIFSSLALVAAVQLNDRGKGLALILGIWLLATVLYDGFILTMATSLSSYPMETPLLIASVINPVDLTRVLFLIHSDMAALMGYTGAVFIRFFDKPLGIMVAAISMIVWFVVPVWFGLNRFKAKDF